MSRHDPAPERHPSTSALLRWFESEHLPAHLRPVSAHCQALAEDVLRLIPTDSPELSAGLRKLLEAKDCFVRAAIDGHDRSTL